MRTCLFLFVIAACGGDDAMTTPDAPGGGADADDSARCLVKGDFGAVGSVTGTVGSAQGATTYTATLDPGMPPTNARDSFFLRLVPNQGVFASGLAPGTYTISGAEASYNDCGLCVHIIADIVMGQGPSKFYFADAGSVTLTSTGPVTGSAQNLHFAEIDINTGAKVPGGCEATIDSITFATQ